MSTSQLIFQLLHEPLKPMLPLIPSRLLRLLQPLSRHESIEITQRTNATAHTRTFRSPNHPLTPRLPVLPSIGFFVRGMVDTQRLVVQLHETAVARSPGTTAVMAVLNQWRATFLP